MHPRADPSCTSRLRSSSSLASRPHLRQRSPRPAPQRNVNHDHRLTRTLGFAGLTPTRCLDHVLWKLGARGLGLTPARAMYVESKAAVYQASCSNHYITSVVILPLLQAVGLPAPPPLLMVSSRALFGQAAVSRRATTSDTLARAPPPR